MNEKTKKKIMEMHKKGMTIYAIAKQLGLSQTGVKYVLDPKYREYMSQISHKRYSKLKKAQPNDTVPSSSDVAWLSKHRQSIEKSGRILKGTGIFALYLALAFTVFIIIFAIFSLIVALVTLPGVVIFAVIFSIALSSNLAFIASRYEEEALIGIFSGVIIGLIFALL